MFLLRVRIQLLNRDDCLAIWYMAAMRFRILAILIFIAQRAESQSFIRLLDDVYPSRWIRTIPLSDTSIGLCLEDSMRFIRLNTCGVPMKSQEFRDDRLFTVGTTAFTPDGYGGMVWVGHRQNLNGIFPLIFLHLKADGTAQTMNQLSLPSGNFYPYSVLNAGNNQFFIFGNASPLVGDIFRFILKVDGNGQVLAQHFGEGGGTWGGASLLLDGGLITRAGSVVYRYDAELNSLWGFNLPIGGDIYEPPVQVKGGFILPRAGDGKYGHFLLNENGGIVSGRSVSIDSVEGWPTSFSDSLGGCFTLLERNFPEGRRPVLLHWDSSGQLQTLLYLDQPANSGQWLAADGFFRARQKEIRFTGLNQQEGRNQVWIGNLKTDSPVSCWKPTSLKVDTLEQWNLISVFLPDRPTFSIASAPFDYRLFPRETSVPAFVCGSIRSRSLDLGPDTTTCGTFSIKLKNRSQDSFSRFRWSNGSVSSTLSISDTGTFWIQALDACEQVWWKDSVRIQNRALPENPVATTLPLCEQSQVFLPASPESWSGIWDDQSAANQPRSISVGGMYRMELQSGTCQTRWEFVVDECEKADFPNFLSQNGDGLNETFMPLHYRRHKPGVLKIWNRWGKEVGEVSDFPNRHWKPTTELSSGLYFWTLQTENFSGESRSFSGWIELLK